MASMQQVTPSFHRLVVFPLMHCPKNKPMSVEVPVMWVVRNRLALYIDDILLAHGDEHCTLMSW